MRLFLHDDPTRKPTPEAYHQGTRFTHSRFDGCIGRWIFNEQGGRTVFDYSSRQKPFTTWVGASAGDLPWTSTGVKLTSSGQDNLDDGANMYDITTTDRFTVMVRFELNATVGTTNVIRLAALQDGTDQYRHFIDFYEVPKKIRCGIDRGSNEQILTGSTVYDLIQGRVYTMTGSYDGSVQRVYVNGKLDGTNTHTTTLWTTSRFTIGKSQNLSPGYHSNINVLDCALYNRALADYEIRSYHEAPYLEFYPVRKWWYVAATAVSSPSTSSEYYLLRRAKR